VPNFTNETYKREIARSIFEIAWPKIKTNAQNVNCYATFFDFACNLGMLSSKSQIGRKNGELNLTNRK
jgi:hypothetical protein